MKKSFNYIGYIGIVILVLFMSSCETPADIPIEKVNISNILIQSNVSSASFACTFSYSGNITFAKIVLSENKDLSSPKYFNSNVFSNTLVVTVTDLKVNSTYYYCFEFENEVSSIRTDIQSFSTIDYTLPSVSAPSISNINGCSANINCNVTDLGHGTIIESGVIWGTNTNISINDNHIHNGNSSNIALSISSLSVNTTYYVRGYAINEKGVGYSELKYFTTTNGIPTVNTKNATSVTSYSAICGGNITSHNGFPITERGVCWSTYNNPTIEDSHTTGGMGIGEFSSSISGLKSKKKYYVKAYAKNINGIAYGEEKVFTTK